jgi:hypothetical protein
MATTPLLFVGKRVLLTHRGAVIGGCRRFDNGNVIREIALTNIAFEATAVPELSSAVLRLFSLVYRQATQCALACWMSKYVYWNNVELLLYFVSFSMWHMSRLDLFHVSIKTFPSRISSWQLGYQRSHRYSSSLLRSKESTNVSINELINQAMNRLMNASTTNQARNQAMNE